MEQVQIDKAIEAILFYRGEPVSFGELAKLLKISVEVVKEHVGLLRERLGTGALTLVETEETVALVTNKDVSELIVTLRKEELSKELSKAALETLSVVLYGDMVSRADIDFIRGVNSSFILRNLLVRGLVERREHPTDSRKIIYIPTADTLTYMGVGKIDDLPEYEEVRSRLERAKEGTNETPTIEEKETHA
jgi:segregation and condensation protein B